MSTTHISGTAAVANGSTTVTGTGSLWYAARLRAGDIFSAKGLTVRIASVESNTSMTLAEPWPGATLPAGSTYEVRYAFDGERGLSTLNDVLTKINVVGDYSEDAAQAAIAADQSAADAATAKTAAEAARDAAQTAETNAEAAQTAVAASASTASTKAGEAATSATNADTAKVAAEGARDTALTHKTDAEAAKTAAETAAGTATTKAGEASTSAGDAAASATDAQTAQTAAETAQAAAEAAAGAATTKAGEANISATNAATSADDAAASATTATTKAGEAATSATNAAASATSASTDADRAEAAAADAEALVATMEGGPVASVAGITGPEVTLAELQAAGVALQTDLDSLSFDAPEFGTSVTVNGAGNSTAAADYLSLVPTDYAGGTGYELIVSKSGVSLNKWDLQVKRLDDVNGVLNVVSQFTVQGQTLATVGDVASSINSRITNPDYLIDPIDSDYWGAGSETNAPSVRATYQLAGYMYNLSTSYTDSAAADIYTSMASKADLNSPALTGVPTAPTAALGTTTTQIATMAALDAAVNALVNGAPGALNQLNELATAMGNDPNFATTMTNSLAGKQPIDANITSINSRVYTAGQMVYWTADEVTAVISTTSFGRGLLNLADAAALRTAAALGSMATESSANYVPKVAGTLETPTIAKGYTEACYAFDTGTATAVDLINGSSQKPTLTGNWTPSSWPAPAAGKGFVLLVVQDATGGRTVTWPASVKWPGGTAPTLTSGAGKGDKIAFQAFDSSNWIAHVVSQNYTVS